MVAGTYEPVISDWLARAVAWSRRTHGQAMVWDVGAHIGVTALCAAAQGASVLACEPAPDTMRELEEHCAANPALSGRVAVERVAVADHGGTLVMRTSAVSSISQIEHVGVAAYAEDGAPHDRIVVPTTTLDTLLERHAPPTVVKVDVEGAEGLVMRGARAVLAKHPAVWIVELHDAQVTTDVLAQFDAAGYVVRRPEARAFGVTRAANAAGPMDSGHLIAVPPGAPWP
jgi:FkbM family methyltransferase